MWCFKQSLTDFLTLVASIVIAITGFRALYLIAILSVNGHVTRFNGFLARITAERNPRMWIKLQQIKTVLEDPEKRRKMNERYLSIKQCVWLTFVEWILDLQVLPFIIVYIVLIPWRLNELFEIAVTQYEGVPSTNQKVQLLKHVARDVSKNQMPKRVQVIYDLFRFLVKDYSTVVITVILLITGWRTINTLETLALYS